MITAEIGSFSLAFALLFSLIQASNLYFLNQKKLPPILNPITSSYLSMLFCGGAFFTLGIAFVTSDFSLKLVYENSYSLKPMIYKISAMWGNHEGSMLLFATLLCGFTVFYTLISQYKEMPHIVAVQGVLSSLILGYILFTSNPFDMLYPIPSEGRGLNPLLQDIGLALHPPTLYVGYTGLSLAISYAITGLLRGVNPTWAMSLRPWVLLTWAWLTMGITMGSWWAYRELGWGGYWFWDPVENASLLPWFAATSLIHCLSVVIKRNLFYGWSIFLGILCYCLALVGFFLVRSGVLNSVHSFASDPTRGLVMLGILAFTMLASFILFVMYYPKAKPSVFAPISRESGILVNNLLLLTLLFTVMLGILYPIITETFFQTAISVGEPYYRKIAIPLMLFTVLLSSISPFVPWKKLTKASLKSIVITIGFSSVIFLFSFAFEMPVLTRISMFVAAASVICSAKWVYTNRAQYGMVLAHLGVGILVLGIALNHAYSWEMDVLLKEGETKQVDDYSIHLKKIENLAQDDHITRRATILVLKGYEEVALLQPEQRLYPIRQTESTEAAISSNLFRDIYIAIGNSNQQGVVAVRFYFNATMLVIWLGAIITALGGIIALFNKIRAIKNV